MFFNYKVNFKEINLILMFSNDLKNVMKTKFNLSDSIINSSKHYKIPNFVFKSRSEKLHNKAYTPIFKNKVISLRSYLNDKSKELKNISKTQYFERKRERMNKMLNNIQIEKIDLLINRAYHKINDNIREYNKDLCLPRKENKLQLDYLPLVQRQKIIEHVMNQTKKYLPFINKKYEFMKYGYKEVKQKISDEEKKNKQINWSHNFIQQKKLEDFQKIYRIKYLNTEQTTTKDKFKDELTQKDFDYPKSNKKQTLISKNRTLRSIKNNQTINSSQISNLENKSIEAKNNNKNE
jgi:hypothetical protein